MTFDHCITGNYRERIEKSLKGKCIQLADRNQIIVERVDALFKLLEFQQKIKDLEEGTKLVILSIYMSYNYF